MSRSKRLRPVSRMAEQRQQDAARSLRQSRDELQGLQQRLDEVLAYRAEYLGRFEQRANGGMSAEQMKDFRAFLGKLDAAVSQLEGLIHSSTGACEQRREEWMASRARCKALEEVLARLRLAEVLDETRREQRRSDEHTTGRTLRRPR